MNNPFSNLFNKDPRPRRAMKSPIKRRSVLIFIASIIGLLGFVAASAVMLPPRIAADKASESVATEETTFTPYVMASPSVTPNKLGPGAKGMPTEKSTKSASPKPTKTMKAKPKKVVPPKVIGTRYACTTLNIRAAAGTKSLVIEKVPPRTAIKIMNRSLGKFRMVRWEGKNRWAYQPCLWVKPPPKPKPPVIKKPAAKKPEAKSTPAPSKPKSTAPKVSSGSVWDRLAQCESGGRWSYNGSSGYDGGLQFLPSTWTAYGGGKYAKYAYQATRSEQIAIAKKVLAAAGWGSWPACSRKLGLR